jgi:NADH:ubiquinone reductase (H+-translocating)
MPFRVYLPEASNRLICDDFNAIKNCNDIFAIGDVAQIESEMNKTGDPQLATTAMQQGLHLAHNFKNLSQNKPLKPFKYNNKGTMATVGRNKAVVELPFFKFGGYFAWLMWMFIHLMSLVGFRNRLSVFLTWCYNYFRYEKALRLIIRPYKRKSELIEN